MSIAPFHPAPARARGEARRARLAVFAALVGIAAALLAYAISPGVRHAVGHAAHSVRHTVSNIFDHDRSTRRDDRAARHRRVRGARGAVQAGGAAAPARRAVAGGSRAGGRSAPPRRATASPGAAAPAHGP
jgi:hypothetical protein